MLNHRILIAGATLAVIVGCRVPMTRVETAIERHTRAVERLPEPVALASAVREGAPDRPGSLPDGLLTLDSARAIAVRDNPDVAVTTARLFAARARVSEAQARYRPTLSLKHSSVRTLQTPPSRPQLASAIESVRQLPTSSADPLDSVAPIIRPLLRPLFSTAQLQSNSNAFSDHSTALTFSWTMFDSFVRQAQVLSARHLHDAAGHGLRDVKRLILQAVDTAYYQVQLAEEQIRIAKADELFSQEQYDETRKLQDASRASQADVDNFRVRVLAAQANLAASVGLRDTGRVVLAELLGVAGAALPSDLALSPLAVEAPDEMAVPDAAPWLARAMASRPDLRQLHDVARSEHENARVAKGLFGPAVALSASWGFDRTDNVHYGSEDQSSGVGVEVHWDLYTGGGRRARLSLAQGLYSEAAARLQRTRLAVAAQVRKAVVELADAQQQIRLQRENVEIARENRRLIRAAYLAGKETLTRLNQTQRDYIEADVQLALARIRLRQAWTDLRAAAAVPDAGATSPGN